MAIGSLYRYFPNKQAIVYELYMRWLEKVVNDIESYISRESTEDYDHETFFSGLLDSIYLYEPGEEGEKTAKMEIELRKAMTLCPELGEVDRLHAIRISKMLSDILGQRGIKASPKVISHLGNYIYAMDGTLEMLQQQTDLSMEQILELQKRALLGVLAPYF